MPAQRTDHRPSGGGGRLGPRLQNPRTKDQQRLAGLLPVASPAGLLRHTPSSLPAERVIRKSSFVVDPCNAEEIKAILAAASEPQHRNLLQFAFATGLRTSELIALQWSDIDWSKHTVHVERAFVEGVMKPPKTEAGIRG